MDESKVDLVKTKRFTINFPSVGAPMAIWAEGDEIVILVRVTLRPRDNVMDVNFDVSTSGDCAAVSGLDKDASPQISRYWRTLLPA